MKAFIFKYIGEIVISIIILIFVAISIATNYTDKPTYTVPSPWSTSDSTKTDEFDIYPWVFML